MALSTVEFSYYSERQNTSQVKDSIIQKGRSIYPPNDTRKTHSLFIVFPNEIRKLNLNYYRYTSYLRYPLILINSKRNLKLTHYIVSFVLSNKRLSFTVYEFTINLVLKCTSAK